RAHGGRLLQRPPARRPSVVPGDGGRGVGVRGHGHRWRIRRAPRASARGRTITPREACRIAAEAGQDLRVVQGLGSPWAGPAVERSCREYSWGTGTSTRAVVYSRLRSLVTTSV